MLWVYCTAITTVQCTTTSFHRTPTMSNLCKVIMSKIVPPHQMQLGSLVLYHIGSRLHSIVYALPHYNIGLLPIEKFNNPLLYIKTGNVPSILNNHPWNLRHGCKPNVQIVNTECTIKFMLISRGQVWLCHKRGLMNYLQCQQPAPSLGRLILSA